MTLRRAKHFVVGEPRLREPLSNLFLSPGRGDLRRKSLA